MNERIYVPLPERGFVTVGGADRVDFLQGLVSNDMRRVAPDRVVWTALLTPQGKYLHDFFVADIGGVWHLDCEAERLMDLGRLLSRYKLRAAVDLGIGQALAAFALPGADALAALGLPAEPGAAAPFGGGLAYVDPRHAALGARAILPAAGAADALSAAGFREGPREAWDRLRLSLGVPDGSRDLTVEKSILLESNFDELHGVDWQKGCYMGQELTARTKYRGLVKKRLVPVAIEGEAPAPGTPLTIAGRDAGEMRSAAGGIGLALLRLDALAEAETGATLEAGGARLLPSKPAWASF
ncbi:MAG: folate-binding protein YgfZ [Alphaproteobacteria bacterium]